MNIPALKLDLIHWLTELQDQSTLEALRSLKDQQSDELNEDIMRLLDERIASYEKNPEQVLDWQTEANKIEKGL